MLSCTLGKRLRDRKRRPQQLASRYKPIREREPCFLLGLRSYEEGSHEQPLLEIDWRIAGRLGRRKLVGATQADRQISPERI